MMMLLSRIMLLDSKQLAFRILFVLLIVRITLIFDIVEGSNDIRYAAKAISGTTSNTEKQIMIDEISRSVKNLKHYIIDEIEEKINNNNSFDSEIPSTTGIRTEFPDNIRPKNGSDIEELGVLDQLPVEVFESGRQQMSHQKVIICGIARDNANDLSTMMKYIERTGQLFSDYRVIIFENDSVDGTKDLLNTWESTNNKVKIITHDYHNVKRPAISFLAEARNYYLYEIANNTDIYQDYDMMMVVDMDMVYGWDMRGLYHSFNRVNDWDMMCSNGISHHSGRMYDMFAFHIIKHSNNQKSSETDDYYFTMVGKSKYFPPDSGLVPVGSCFGGLAFYRLSSIEGCYYDSLAGGCEHIPFHNCIKSQHQGRLYMNPAQIIRYSHYK